MLNVTVRNEDGQNLRGLSRDAFELIDEKQVRPLAFFDDAEAPLSIGILVDTSASMQLFESRETARAKPIGDAIAEFLELSNAGSEYFVMSFDKAPHLLTDWKSAKELLDQQTTLIQEKRDTALYDACWAALEKLNTGHHPRRALILFSDGQDNVSKLSFVKLRDRLRGSDLTLYSVGVIASGLVGSTLGLEGQSILSEFAEVTGGEVFIPQGRRELSSAVRQIALELRHKYRIGFVADRSLAPNKWRRLKVRVKPPANVGSDFKKIVVRNRQGYFTE